MQESHISTEWPLFHRLRLGLAGQLIIIPRTLVVVSQLLPRENSLFGTVALEEKSRETYKITMRFSPWTVRILAVQLGVQQCYLVRKRGDFERTFIRRAIFPFLVASTTTSSSTRNR